MLYKVLQFLAGGNIKTPADLARELNVSPALIEQMTLQLTRQGYLQDVSPRCFSGCDGCALKAACSLKTAENPGTQPKLWAITDKGLAALERLRQ